MAKEMKIDATNSDADIIPRLSRLDCYPRVRGLANNLQPFPKQI
jgi:hypothetical protein